MELLLDNGNATYQIKCYENGHIVLNQSSHSTPIIVTPNQLIAPWGPATLNDLSESHFDPVIVLKPQIVLIGTGVTLQRLNPKLLASLMQHKIGFEIMNTAAACRTYTVLMAEGRKVAACLIN